MPFSCIAPYCSIEAGVTTPMRNKVPKDLELNLLRTFLALVEHRNMRKTADAIHITQPAVSSQMRRLGRIVGHALFVRCRTGVELSPHGELLVHYAKQALQLSEQALTHLRAVKSSTQASFVSRARLSAVFSGEANRSSVS